MSCPHTETTTVRWAYGDGPEEHVHHIVECAACQAVVARLEAVEAATAHVRPALPRPRLRLRFAGVAGMLLAATALLSVWRFSADDEPIMLIQSDEGFDLLDDPMDDDLAAIEDDLDWLDTEFDLL